jgi:hypothetical protein
MRPAPLILTLVAILAQTAWGDGGREVTVTLPRALRAGEMVWLEVELGALARGQELSVSTMSGRSLGTISPYGPRSGQEGGTYTVPLPPDVIAGDRVTVRLTIGNAKRAPKPDELKSVRVKVAPTMH